MILANADEDAPAFGSVEVGSVYVSGGESPDEGNLTGTDGAVNRSAPSNEMDRGRGRVKAKAKKPAAVGTKSKSRGINLEKNRMAARESRRRKKELQEELQRSVIFFSRANNSLKRQGEELQQMLDEARAQVAAIEVCQAHRSDAAAAEGEVNTQIVDEQNNVTVLQSQGCQQGMNLFNLGPVSLNKQQENNGFVANFVNTSDLNNAGVHVAPAMNLNNFINMQNGSLVGGVTASSSVGNDFANDQYAQLLQLFTIQQQQQQQQQQPCQGQVAANNNFVNSVPNPVQSAIQFPYGTPNGAILQSQVFGGNNMINPFLYFGV